MTEATGKPQYFVVKDDHYEYLIKREGGEQTFLLRAEKREQIYDVILTDLCAPVFEATPGQFFEIGLGEPQWRYSDKFEPRALPAPRYPAPKLDEEKPPHRPRSPKGFRDGRTTTDFCEAHNIKKQKDGYTRDGRQRYKCDRCTNERAGRVHRARNEVGRNNPKCERCGERMRANGSWKGTRYYKCRACPPLPRGEQDNGAALEKFVRERVARVNGHESQLRDDIVQELVMDILAGKLNRKDVNKRSVVKRYIRSQQRLSQNRHRDVSIEQPLNNQGESLRLADVLEG